MRTLRAWMLTSLLVAGCKSVPESETVIYRGITREANAKAIVSILKCLPQPDCEELLGERLECGPFLWRQLASLPAATGLTNPMTYMLPQNVAGGSQDVKWEGRRCENREQVRALWRAFTESIPQKSLQTIRTLSKEECRLYSALVPGEIREPVFILEGGGHKVLMQLASFNGRLTLTFLDDLRDVAVKD